MQLSVVRGNSDKTEWVILFLGALPLAIEIAFRTHIAYLIAHNYEQEGHLDAANFESEYHHKSFLEEMQACIKKSGKDLFIAHHISKYGGRFPVWVVLEVITLGGLSKLYANLITKDKKKIASEYYRDIHIIEAFIMKR